MSTEKAFGLNIWAHTVAADDKTYRNPLDRGMSLEILNSGPMSVSFLQHVGSRISDIWPSLYIRGSTILQHMLQSYTQVLLKTTQNPKKPEKNKNLKKTY
jgi:hypothetical protein